MSTESLAVPSNRARRVVCCVSATFAALAVLALVGATGAGANPGPTPNAKLLRTFQPVLIFHPARLAICTSARTSMARCMRAEHPLT